jgi:N-acetylglutamate synthase-like GNAT family acetyltransferase
MPGVQRGNGIEAYVLSHPWLAIAPPALNSLLGELPAVPSTYYIHDLALAPEVRGTGAAAEIVGWLAAHALASWLSNMTLIAVNGSSGFWQRQGFDVTHNPSLRPSCRAMAVMRST